MICITSLLSINHAVVLINPSVDGASFMGDSMNKMLRMFGYSASADLISAINAMQITEAREAIQDIVHAAKQAKGDQVEHVTLSRHQTKDLWDFVYCDWPANRINYVWELNTQIAAGAWSDVFDTIAAPTKTIHLLSLSDARTWIIQAITQPQTCAPSERTAIINIGAVLAGQGLGLCADDVLHAEIWRENIPVLLRAMEYPQPMIAHYCTTSSDVLRLAAYLSSDDADLSLATAPRFALSAAQRRMILGLVDRVGKGEDMMRHREVWLRLGERLHPMAPQHSKRWPHAASLWDALRNAPKDIERWNATLEQALQQQDTTAIPMLASRPGAFARALNALLTRPTTQNSLGFRQGILESFARIVDDLPTHLLLTLYKRFIDMQSTTQSIAVFYPKGADSAPLIVDDTRAPPEAGDITTVIQTAYDALIRRLGQLPTLGKVWVDPALSTITINRTKRGAMTGSNIPMHRGCTYPMSKDVHAIRLFVHWANKDSRVDVDLSATIMDEAFNRIESANYYHLNSDTMAHSGDITDGRDGASEYIDIHLDAPIATGNRRYIAIFINSFTGQSFSSFPCFAGVSEHATWPIARDFDARAVAMKFDITTQGRCCIPLIYDLVERRVVVINANAQGRAGDNLHTSGGLIQAIVRDAVEAPLHKLNCHDVAILHATARGTLVDTPADADTVFSTKTTTEDTFTAMASDADTSMPR